MLNPCHFCLILSLFLVPWLVPIGQIDTSPRGVKFEGNTE